MLEANDLTKRYNGNHALDSLNLKIEPGQVFCLLGARIARKELIEDDRRPRRNTVLECNG
jgi:ABC-type uncharacterized transport system ATPase subunit